MYRHTCVFTLFLCIYLFIYIYIYMCVCACVFSYDHSRYTYIYICIYTHVNECLQYIYIYIYLCEYIYIYTYFFMDVCRDVLYIYTYVCVRVIQYLWTICAYIHVINIFSKIWRSLRSGGRGAETERRTTTEVVRLVPGGGELEEARTLRARVMKCLGRSEIWGLSQISNRLSMVKP